MKVLRFATVLLVSAAGVASGCGAFSGVDQPDPTPPPPEAGADALPADPDAVSPDAGGHFCTTVDAAFCADFDEGPVGQGWTIVKLANGTASLVPTAAFDAGSPPNALGVRILDQTNLWDAASDAGPPPGYAILSRELLRGNRTKIAVDLDMHAISLAGVGAYMAVMSVVLTRTPLRYLSVIVKPDESALLVYDPDLSFVLAPRLPVDWFHCRLEADIAAGTARLLYDGKEVAKKESGSVVSSEPAFSVEIGVYLTPAVTDTRVEYDNVVVTFQD